MSNDINLLGKTQEGKQQKIQKKKGKLIRIISLTLLGFTILVSIVLFLISVSSPIQNLQQEETAAENGIKGSATKLSTYLLLQERVKALKGILPNRLSLDKWIDVFQQEFPTDVTIESITINSKNIQFTLSSTSLLSLKEVIEKTSIKDSRHSYKAVVVNGINYDSALNRYSLKLSADCYFVKPTQKSLIFL